MGPWMPPKELSWLGDIYRVVRFGSYCHFVTDTGSASESILRETITRWGPRATGVCEIIVVRDPMNS